MKCQFPDTVSAKIMPCSDDSEVREIGRNAGDEKQCVDRSGK